MGGMCCECNAEKVAEGVAQTDSTVACNVGTSHEYGADVESAVETSQLFCV